MNMFQRKYLTLYFVAAFFLNVNATKNVDSIISKIKLSSVPNLEFLADTLTSQFQTDSEKVRAIYFWITENISYDYKQYKKAKYGIYPKFPDDMDYETWHYEKLMKVVRKRKGICQDYADLLTYLCRVTGILSETVSGYGASHRVCILMLIDKKETNHAWNAVRIGNKWRLIDACWGSKQVVNGRVVEERDDFYFCCSPSEFIVDHRPLFSKWQLLNEHVSMKEFRQTANANVKAKSSWYSYWTPF
jgi:transglutaminase/protease-like cytokinesis protein 3